MQNPRQRGIRQFETSIQSKPCRRWFQYSLRTTLVLVTLLCVPLTLWVNPARKQGTAVAAIKALEGWVSYEHPQEPPGPEWLRKLVGEEYFGTIIEVSLNGTNVTDKGLEHLKGLASLRMLNLDNNNQITDKGLEHLKGLASLQRLGLYKSQITDAGLEHLKELTNLTYLGLANTKVTDEHVKKLQKALPNCKIAL